VISKWVPNRMASLGTDGFGRSEGRTSLREFFEVDTRFIVVATLNELFLDGKIEASVVDQAIKCLGIDADKPNPAIS
jgi:pyruvate dehydrogenase E1 component